MGLPIPVLPAYAEALGASATRVGLLLAGSAVAGIVVTLPAAAVAGLVGRGRVLVATAAVTALSSIWCGLAGSFGTLAVFCLVEGGMAGAFSTVGTATAVSDAVPAARTRAVALYQGAALVGVSAGSAVGGLIGSQHMRLLFFTNAAAGGLAGC